MIPVGKPRKSARHDSRVNFADLGGKNQRIQFAFSHPNSEESDDGNYEFFFIAGKMFLIRSLLLYQLEI